MQHSWTHRARERMKAVGISQEMLADALGCTRGAVGHYLSGRRNPALNQLEIIAGILHLDPRWLVFGHEAGYVRESGSAYHTSHPGLDYAPVIGTTKGELSQQPLGKLALAPGLNTAYALVVAGSEWAPRIYEGDILLLCPDRKPVPGDEIWIRYCSGKTDLQSLVSFKADQVILDRVAGKRERQIKALTEVEWMHCILAVFRGSAGGRSATTDGTENA